MVDENMRKRKKKITKTLVSIIIPVHRRFDLLGECLKALPDAFDDIAYEVIMIDNASPTDEAKSFYEKWKKHRVIRNKENLGFPKACNRGANVSKSPLLFFLNSDVLMHPGSGKLLVDVMDDPQIAVCGMKLLFPDEDDRGLQGPPGKVQHVGLSTNIRGHMSHHLIGWSSDNPRVNQVRDVYAVTGAAMMTRKEHFRKLGGFFEGYGMGTYEDADYCLTCRDLGYNVIVEPKAVGIHYTGATSRAYNLFHPLQQNQMIFMQRWQQKLMWTEWNIL
jgi:GT2 family glycosyltransferase